MVTPNTCIEFKLSPLGTDWVAAVPTCYLTPYVLAAMAADSKLVGYVVGVADGVADVLVKGGNPETPISLPVDAIQNEVELPTTDVAGYVVAKPSLIPSQYFVMRSTPTGRQVTLISAEDAGILSAALSA